jgi:hypothetical protein
MDEQLELFKLDYIDRKVFFWLLDHTSRASIRSWIMFIAADYNRRGAATIDPEKFCKQAYEVVEIPFNSNREPIPQS